jgi:hypothetical protein
LQNRPNPNSSENGVRPGKLTRNEQLILRLLQEHGESSGIEVVDLARGLLRRGDVYLTLFDLTEKNYVTLRKTARDVGPIFLPRGSFKVTRLGLEKLEQSVPPWLEKLEQPTVRKPVSRALRERMSLISRGCSERKRQAVRRNGLQPCKNGQRGRPKIHELCDRPMRRIDHHRHWCAFCGVLAEYPDVYIRPERRKEYSKNYAQPPSVRESLASGGWT